MKNKIYDEHTAIRVHPKNLNINDLVLFSDEFSKNIPETTIEILDNIDILKDTVFNRHKFIFYKDHTNVEGFPIKNRKLRNFCLFLKPYDEINEGIWIKDNWSWTYFHWLTDAVTRLIASEEFIDSHFVLLPKDYEKFNYIRQSLEFLNYKIKFYDSLKRLHVKKLLLPSHTAPVGNYNKKIINKVRERFLSKNRFELMPTKKIYISRQKARFRKISNEAELIFILKKHGYEIHFFEDYDFCKQVYLMQQASHLVSLHGAGLTNMIFMPKTSKVLEIRNLGDQHNNCYFSLASDLGHEYYYLINKGDSNDTHFANINVDIDKIECIILQMHA